MKYLIDTNILIWYIEGNPKLHAKIKKIIQDPKSDIIISIILFWEISIKFSLGKLRFSSQLKEIFKEISDKDYFNILSLKQSHILKQLELPFHHRAPFDRLIYAQAKIEKLEFLYTDKIFDKY